MNDKTPNVLEKYDFKVLRTYRGRGTVICETNQGLKLLREFTGSRQRAEFQDALLKRAAQSAALKMDAFVRNSEGEIISTDRENTAYVVKDWYEGRECDVKSQQEILEAIRCLAQLHQSLHLKPEEVLDEEKPVACRIEDMKEEYEKHHRELKKVRNFIKGKSRMSDFEISFVKSFPYFFDQGEEVLKKLENSDYETLKGQSLKEGSICHGEYNHHNILMLRQQVAVINFEKCYYGIQIGDLYQFMRKILEKHDWNLSLGNAMLNEYDKVSPLNKEERENLYLRFLYPEKFWKIANHYYNNNKAWIPVKNIEKLELLSEREEKRAAFLDYLR